MQKMLYVLTGCVFMAGLTGVSFAGTVKTISDDRLADQLLSVPHSIAEENPAPLIPAVKPSQTDNVQADDVQEIEQSDVSSMPQQATQEQGLEQQAVSETVSEQTSEPSKDETEVIEQVQSKEVAAEDVVPLYEVLEYAYQYNPTLRAARAEMHSVEELVPQAFAGYLPTAQAVGSISDVDNSDSNFGSAHGSTSKSMSVEFSQPIFKGGATMSGMDKANLLVKAQGSLLNVTEQQVILDVATIYMDVLSSQSLLTLAENNQKVIERQLQASRDRFEVGELTLTDVAQAEARLANAQAEYVQALADFRSARAEYNRLTGQYAKNLQAPEIIFQFPENLDDAIGLARKSNYEIIAAKAIHEAAEEDIDVNFAAHLPDVNLSGSWDRTYEPQPGLLDEQTTKTIGLTATVPLYQAGSVQSKVRESKHIANQRYLEVMEVTERIEKDVVAAWEDLHLTFAEIESRTAQIKAARIAREGVGYENDLGVRTVLDVLDADQELLDAENSLVIAQRDRIVAQFQLAKTLGLLTPDQLWLRHTKD